MKSISVDNVPINVLVGKDIGRGLYTAVYDSRQAEPRLEVGSFWVGHDKRHRRKFLLRVVETGYTDGYDLRSVLIQVRENPDRPFDAMSLEYFCGEKAWLQLEGEFKEGRIVRVADQPTVLQTFLEPTTKADHDVIAAADARGFAVGQLRNGDKVLPQLVTLEDRFMGFRTAILGASGYGKSTLVRSVARFWLEQDSYGKLIDDLKCEYPFDIQDERGNIVPGLAHHPDAAQRLFLLTTRPQRFSAVARGSIAGVIPLQFDLNDIPPESLKDIAELSVPQRQFVELYADQPGLFHTLLKSTDDGDPDMGDWHRRFKAWIILKNEAERRAEKEGEAFKASPGDFQPSSYLPMHGVRKKLTNLAQRPFIATQGARSCLDEVKTLLNKGATIILDKSGLTDEDKVLVSTVLASRLYDHNAQHSSGAAEDQDKVVPFVYLVEEAHNLLSNERAKEGSVFVNFAKTGRSFQIGLVAVTQRPTSVDTNIMSQFDNFITLRLTNEEDVKDLLKAQSMFRGYENQIRTMGRGAAVTAFGEPTKVQSVQVFAWTDVRAGTRSSDETNQKETVPF